MIKQIHFFFLSLFFMSGCALLGSQEVSEPQINAEAVKAYAEVKKTSKLSKDRRLTNMVQRVANRIAKASGEPFQWEVILIESDQKNAWCMPGGKMAVYTGILPVLRTEAALAAVLGHEVAHATLRHGLKGYARAVKTKMTGLLVGGAVLLGGEILCKTEKCKQLSRVGALATGFAAQFFDRKFSRGNETNADKEGQILMARAGYDPREAPKVWGRMSQSGGAKPPEWMSTHPADERRQRNLTNWLSETTGVYNRASHKYGLGERI